MSSVIEIDIISIFLAAVFNMGLGMFWYSSFFLGPRWIKLMDMSKAKMPKDMSLIYSLVFFASLLAAFTLELFISSISFSNGWTGMMIGFWSGMGIASATSLPDYLFAGDQKKNELYLINSGFHIVSLMVMGLILGI